MLIPGILAAFLAAQDSCAAASTTDQVQFRLTLKEHPPVFQSGEIIPLALSFRASIPGKFWADVRNYDRSGRLTIEWYCLEPAAPDPLSAYFKGAFLGGGLGSIAELVPDQALQATAELNEYRTPSPGRYRLYAISSRVWRPSQPGRPMSARRTSETVRSNVVELEVRDPDPVWQEARLREATQVLAGPADAAHREARIKAARVLRFLNTRDSALKLAELFCCLIQEHPEGWELMMGLWGASDRQSVLAAMRRQVASPDHPVTAEYLSTIVNLEVNADPAWDPSAVDGKARQAYVAARLRQEVEDALRALGRKRGPARAMTLQGLLTSQELDVARARALRPALMATWSDLPRDAQERLIQSHWPRIAGPEMVPVLRKMLQDPPKPHDGTVRNAILWHLFELDPAAGREAIVHEADLPAGSAQIATFQLLPASDQAALAARAADRITSQRASDLDFQSIAAAGEANLEARLAATFEPRIGKWACAPQSGFLRYFLRVDPRYGVAQARASLAARKVTGCYRSLLVDLQSELPVAQAVALEALDDPDKDVVIHAAEALSRYGTAAAEERLWERWRRARGSDLETPLASSIARGRAWLCGPEKLEHLRGSVSDAAGWIAEWKQPGTVTAVWSGDRPPSFSLFLYSGLSEQELGVKLGQMSRGTRLQWTAWGASTPDQQENVFRRIRAQAERVGVRVEKAQQP